MFQNPTQSAFVCALIATLFCLYKRIITLRTEGKKLVELVDALDAVRAELYAESNNLRSEVARLTSTKEYYKIHLNIAERINEELRVEVDRLESVTNRFREENDDART